MQAALAAAGSDAAVAELPESARTAEQAAAAVGCPVGAIVKSLVFRGAASGGLWLILVSGANRVHEKRLGRLLGDPLERADASGALACAIVGGGPVGVEFSSEVLSQYPDKVRRRRRRRCWLDLI